MTNDENTERQLPKGIGLNKETLSAFLKLLIVLVLVWLVFILVQDASQNIKWGIVAFWILVIFILVCLGGYLSRWEWTGFIEPRKTLWDWMKLLIVPIVLALGAFALNLAQDARQNAIEENRRQEDLLRQYFDYLGEFARTEDEFSIQSCEDFVENGRSSNSDQSIFNELGFVQANTNYLIRQLDEAHVPDFVLFLTQAGLLPLALDCDFDDLIRMSGLDLRSEDFSWMSLRNADFSGATLIATDFRGATLIDADFRCADLWQANFRDDAILMRADFTGANLQNAYFDDATISNLVGVTLPDGSNTGDGIDSQELERFTNLEHPDFIEYSCEE